MSRARHHSPHETPAPHSTAHYDEPAKDREKANPRLTAGLHILLDGYKYAHELRRDRWEFAVEIEVLHAAGLNNNDLRWLIGKGYVEQAVETKSKGKVRRNSHREGRFVLSRGSCFVLTDAGVKLVQTMLAATETGMSRQENEPQPKQEQAIEEGAPRWDSVTHTLYWRGQIVKHFKHEAPFQEAILEAFQPINWACYVVVTLPKEEGVNPKERLRATIKNLNRSCGGKLRFTQRVMEAESVGNHEIDLPHMYQTETPLLSLIPQGERRTMTTGSHYSHRG